jgi:hypothetical protein
MDTASILTLHLAEALGLYLVAVSAGALIAPDHWRALGRELENSPGLTLVMGVFAFAISAAMLIAHHGMDDPLAIIVTAAAAAGVAEGLLMLVVPQALVPVSRWAFEHPRAWAIVTVALGLLLLAAGLTGDAAPIP